MARRVAILGAEGLRSSNVDITLDSFPWSDVGRIANLSDYNTVILNLLPIAEVQNIDWGRFVNVLDVQTATEILRHEDGMIIVIGDPSFIIQYQYYDEEDRSVEEVEEPFLEWTGLNIVWDDRPGKTIQRVWSDPRDKKKFERYLSRMTGWAYSLRSVSVQEFALLKALGIPNKKTSGGSVASYVSKTDFLTNGPGAFLAGRFNLGVGRKVFGGSIETKFELGPIVLLPRTGMDDHAALVTTLHDACGIDLVTTEPRWATTLTAPGELEITTEIDRLNAELRSIHDRLKVKEDEREIVRRPLRLLFGQHDDLETAVREALTTLGAEIHFENVARNEADGLIRVQVEDETLEGVLEIKGTTRREFDEQGLRQLRQWVGYGIEEGKDYKGIFIGNAAANMVPSQRREPFGANFVKNATKQGFALLKTEDLYLVYQLKSLGRFDMEAFWRQLFATKGTFDMTPYRLLLSQGE